MEHRKNYLDLDSKLGTIGEIPAQEFTKRLMLLGRQVFLPGPWGYPSGTTCPHWSLAPADPDFYFLRSTFSQ